MISAKRTYLEKVQILDYLKPLLAAASGRSLLSVPRILRSNLQVVLNTVNCEHEFWVGDAPSSFHTITGCH